MTDQHETDTDPAVWKAIGAELGRARRALHLSKRAAAGRAGFSEVTWRQLEDGEKQIARGLKVPVSPKDETLAAAAEAVKLNPAVLFGLAGRDYVEGIAAPAPPSVEELAERIDGIDERIGRIEEALNRGGPESGPGELRAAPAGRPRSSA